jgi:hypothetical protein
MSKGALAMAVVKVRAQEKPGASSRSKHRELAALVGVSENTLSRAQVAYDHAPDLVPQVLGGASLEVAHTETSSGRPACPRARRARHSVPPSSVPLAPVRWSNSSLPVAGISPGSTVVDGRRPGSLGLIEDGLRLRTVLCGVSRWGRRRDIET